MPNFSTGFLLKWYCILLKTFFPVNWGHESTVQPDTLWLCILSLPCDMDYVLHLLAGGCSLPIFIFPRKSPTGQPFLSACCRLASTHLDMVPLPWCSSRTIILLWQWQSLSLWSVPGIQNKQAMPTLKGGSAAAAKSECRMIVKRVNCLGHKIYNCNEDFSVDCCRIIHQLFLAWGNGHAVSLLTTSVCFLLL